MTTKKFAFDTAATPQASNQCLCSNDKCCKMQPWFVVISAALFFFYIYIQMNVFNAVGPAILKEFNCDALQLSKLASYYFYGNILFLFPAGVISDRFSIRKLLTIAVMLCVICTYFFATAHSLVLMNLARFGIGLTGAFCFLPAIKLASRWFPANRIALVVGLVVTVGMLGGTAAQTPLTLLADSIGWRNATLAIAGLGVLLLLIILVCVRDYPTNMAQNSNTPRSGSTAISFWHSIIMVLKNTQNWFTGFYISLLNLPLFVLGGTWGSLYLVQAHALSRADASYVTSMLFVGMIIGSPLAGWISDKLGLRRLPMVIGMVIATALMMTIVYSPSLSFVTLATLFFVFGVIASTQVIGYPVVNESNPPALTATANALSSILIVGGGTLTPIFGALLEKNWDHKIVDGIAIYAVSDYRVAMTMFIVAFIIGLIFVLLVKETHCRNITVKNE